MKILVTGGAGFIGINMVNELRRLEFFGNGFLTWILKNLYEYSLLRHPHNTPLKINKINKFCIFLFILSIWSW